jgi:hypothetical protein
MPGDFIFVAGGSRFSVRKGPHEGLQYREEIT